MGNVRRIKKRINGASTGVTVKAVVVKSELEWKGLPVCLLIPSMLMNTPILKEFNAWLRHIIQRSNSPNLKDMYAAHFELLRKQQEALEENRE